MPQDKQRGKLMRKVKKLVLTLPVLALLTGCAPTNSLVATADQEVRAKLCRSWRHQTISKNDALTDETASQIEASNKSRPAWGCTYGK